MVSSGVSFTSWGEGVSLTCDGVTIKIPYGADVVLHWPTLYPMFSYWVFENWMWIIRSNKADLRSWTLVIAVIEDDACPFLYYLDLTCHFTGIRWNRNRYFLVTLYRLIVKMKPESRDQEASPSAGKNTGLFLDLAAHGRVYLRLLPVVWMFPRSLGVICYDRQIIKFVRIRKITSWISASRNHSLFFWFMPFFWINEMVILSKVCKPDNFESHNSLKVSFANIRSLLSTFVGRESLFESNSPDILALFETNLEDSIDSSNFFLMGYLPLIRKDSVTHMHDLEVFVKEGFPFVRNLSLKTLNILIYVFDWLIFFRSLTSFSFIDHHVPLWA